MEGVRPWFREHGLTRPRRGRVFAGVCAGLARSIGTNVWLVRVAAVLSIVLPGPQILAYVVLWICMPPE